MGLLDKIFGKPQKPEICVFCNKSTVGEEKNTLKFEALDDEGQLQEYVYGDMCQSCADVLDDGDVFSEMGD